MLETFFEPEFGQLAEEQDLGDICRMLGIISRPEYGGVVGIIFSVKNFKQIQYAN